MLGLGLSIVSAAIHGHRNSRTLSTILAANPGSHWWDMRYTGSSPQLYQDAAGTQPVTAVGQYLGLCLDKPSGVVEYGPELVVNGDGSTLTGWDNASGNWAATAGSFVNTAGLSIRSPCTLTVGWPCSLQMIRIA